MSDVPQLATQVMAAAPALQATSTDALTQALMWLVGIVVGGIAIAKPAIEFVRRNRSEDGEEKVFVAKNSAEAYLYTHLSDQIKEQSSRASEAIKNNIELTGRVVSLESQLHKLHEQSDKIEELEERLNIKDAEMSKQLREAAEERKEFLLILKAKDQEIISRDLRIAALDRRQLELEVRLTRDEVNLSNITHTNFCPECSHCRDNAHELLEIVSLEQAELADQLTTQSD